MRGVEKWGKDNIKWLGNKNTNKSTRRGYIPYIIVNHITEGTAKSCINWFTSSKNKISSAHFLVARDGQIYQFVKIEDNAWANGLTEFDARNSKLNVIKNRGVNPNWYSVSIEHEGVFAQTKGSLTSLQQKATILLHEYIISYIKDVFDTNINADREHIIGHNIVDPKRKPNCPGVCFPFDEIVKTINIKNKLELALITLVDKQVIKSPDYWIENAIAGGTIKGEYAAQLILNVVNVLCK